MVATALFAGAVQFQMDLAAENLRGGVKKLAGALKASRAGQAPAFTFSILGDEDHAMFPDSPNVYDSLGDAQCLKGDEKGALESRQNAVRVAERVQARLTKPCTQP